ncbi:MAG: GNAT family N-acetyltransferase [Clostridia bacterium]
MFEEFRGKGYGKILINKAMKVLGSLKYKNVYIWTDQAPDFYKKIGFKFTQIIEKNEGGEGELYTKEL